MSDMDLLFGIACESTPVAISEVSEKVDEAVDSIIVAEGWGSTGYYTAQALEDAAIKNYFPENTRSFLGHPEDGKEEPAAGTVGYLAGNARFVASDPEAGGKATLRAPFMPFEDRRRWLSQRAKVGAVALSLRAPVAYKMGEMEGKYGRIVTGFTQPAYSVDVVARPGAGGRIGVFKESALPEQQHENQEGSEMPLSAEEMAAIATETAKAVATALAPSLTGLTDALGKVQVAHESSAPKALPISSVMDKLSKAKLGDKPQARVLTAIESAKPEEVTEAFVDGLIATESSLIAEAVESVKAGLKAGTIKFDGDNGEIIQEGNASEAAVIPKGWGVSA